jgi:hypothetical protein
MKSASDLFKFTLTAVLLIAASRAQAGLIVDFAADRGVIAAPSGEVFTWADQSGNSFDAVRQSVGPTSATAVINGMNRTVLHFDGSSRLISPPHVSPVGSLLAVYGNSVGFGRLMGWEDSTIGKHGLSVEPHFNDATNIVARNNQVQGDILQAPPNTGFEALAVTWGPAGITLNRRLQDGTLVSAVNHDITAISDGGFALHIGGPADDNPILPGWHGDLLTLRVYDAQLDPTARNGELDELYQQWIAVPEPSTGFCAIAVVSLILVQRRHRQSVSGKAIN